MADPAIDRATRALRHVVRRGVEHHTQKPMRAIVRRVKPLAVEVIGHGLELDEDDLLMCQQVRVYDEHYTLRIGDVLIVHPVGPDHDDWVATSVVSEKDEFEGADTKATIAGGTIGGGNLTGATATEGGGPVTGGSVAGTPIVGTVPYRNEEGVIIGRLPLLAP